MTDFLSESNRIEAMKKVDELVVIMSDVPPTSIFDTLQTQNAKISFEMERTQNFHIAHRIVCRAQGIKPVYPVPEEMKGLVISRTAYLNAMYNLVYECWGDLRVIAIKEGLISQGGQPKDFFKLLLDTQYIDIFTSLDNDKRTIKKQLNSQNERIKTTLEAINRGRELSKKASNLVKPESDPVKTELDNKLVQKAYEKTENDLNKSIAAHRRGWMSKYKSLTRPTQLLIDIADELSKTSSVVATAKDYYLNARNDKVQAESDCFRISYLESL
jgi:hypothetical protein